MENKTAFIKSFPITAVVAVVTMLVLWIGFGLKDWGLSILLGSFTSLWAMSMLSKSATQVLKLDEKEAKRKTVINYLIRYVVYAIVLVVAQLSNNLNIIGVAIGLISFKAILYINLFIERQGEKNG